VSEMMQDQTGETRFRGTARLRLIGPVLAVAAVILLAAGCGSNSSSSDSSGGVQNVSMISNLWPGIAPFVVAHDQGLDKQNGVDLNIKFVEQLTDVTAAMGSGRADVAYSVGPGQAMTMLQAGIPIKFLMIGDVSVGGDQVLGDPSINGMAGLKGKTVGIEHATTGYPLLVDGLQHAGLTIDDVNDIELSASQAAVALQSGQVDAAYTYQPYVNQTLAKGFKSLYKAGDNPGIVSDLLIGRSDWVDSNSDAAQGVIKTWQAGVDYLKAHPQSAYQITGKAMDIPTKDLAPLLDSSNVKLNTLPEAVQYFNDQFPKLIPTFVSIVNGAKDAPSQISASDVQSAVDPGPLNAAAASSTGSSSSK
jgi:NitT/TauT family transport system substrate-binding protein